MSFYGPSVPDSCLCLCSTSVVPAAFPLGWVVLTEITTTNWSGKFVQAQKSQRITCFYLMEFYSSLQNSNPQWCLQRPRLGSGVLPGLKAAAPTRLGCHAYTKAWLRTGAQFLAVLLAPCMKHCRASPIKWTQSVRGDAECSRDRAATADIDDALHSPAYCRHFLPFHSLLDSR
jgi:hypothetical protein